MKSFCARKNIIKKVKKPTEWEKLSANHISDTYVMEKVTDFIFLGSKITTGW